MNLREKKTSHPRKPVVKKVLSKNPNSGLTPSKNWKMKEPGPRFLAKKGAKLRQRALDTPAAESKTRGKGSIAD